MSTQKKTPASKKRNTKQVVAHLQNKNDIKELERLKMIKRGEQKEIKIEGTEYLFQHPGLLESIRMRDRSKNEAGSMIEETIYRELMEHVIFQKDGGKVDFDFFEENAGFTEVMSEAMSFTFR